VPLKAALVGGATPKALLSTLQNVGERSAQRITPRPTTLSHPLASTTVTGRVVPPDLANLRL